MKISSRKVLTYQVNKNDSSIKIDNVTKNKIERLRTQISLNTGQMITQQQLFDLLTDWAINNIEIITKLLLDSPVILSKEERKIYQQFRKKKVLRVFLKKLIGYFMGEKHEYIH